MPSTTTNEINRKDLLQVLLAEYSAVRSEMRVYTDLFHRQTTYIAVFLSVVGSGVGIVATWYGGRDVLPPALATPLQLTWPWDFSVLTYQLLAFIGYLLIALIANLFVATTQSHLYLIDILARRSAALEERINSVLGEEVLVWDCLITPQVIGRFKFRGLWLYPGFLRLLWSYLILGFVILVEIITATAMLGRPLGWLFIWLALTVLSFQVLQIVLYQRSEKHHFGGIISRLSGPSLTRGRSRREQS